MDVRALARTVEIVISGSLMTWATYREGAAADWIARDVEAVLAPYLPGDVPAREAAARGTTRERFARQAVPATRGADDEPTMSIHPPS